MKIATRIILGLSLIFSVTLAMGLLNILQSVRIDQIANNFRQTDKLLSELIRLQTLILDDQASYRAFLLSGNAVFLEPYYKAEKRLPAQFDKLEQLMSSQQENLKMLHNIREKHKWIVDTLLDPLFAAKFNEQKEPEAYRKIFDSLVKPGFIRKQLDEERDRVVSLLNIHIKEDIKQEQMLYENSRKGRYITIISLLVSLLVCILIATVMVRKDVERMNKLVAAADRIASGDHTPIEDKGGDEVHSAILALNKMTAKTKESFEEIKTYVADLEQFAWITTHDMREPVRNINTYLQILEEKNPDFVKKNPEDMLLIRENATRMKQLMEGLRQFLMLYEKKEKKEIETRKLLVCVVKDLKEEIIRTHAQVNIGPVPDPIFGCEDLIELLFQNLLDNSIKFRSEEPPVITIDGVEKEAEWLFNVSDNGIGIDEQYQDKVFMIFHRLHTYEKYPGAGIGLALCKKIVEKHKGRIWFESKVNGTTFHFTIARPLPGQNEDIAQLKLEPGIHQ